MADLNARVALVTGAAGMRGIGRAIAIRLAKEGADIVVVDHPDVTKRFTSEMHAAGWKGLATVAEQIQFEGRRCLDSYADVSCSSQVDELVDRTLRHFGRIDILVNNAGILGPATPVVTLQQGDWERVIQVNLTGPFLLSKAVAKGMINKGAGGKIIMIASTVAKTGIVGRAAYCSSKAGLIGLTQTLALELAQYKINVNAICPGAFATDIHYELIETLARERGITYDEAWREHYGSSSPSIPLPLGRRGRPDEVANAVLFLACAESDYITGQAINVCGGSLMAR